MQNFICHTVQYCKPMEIRAKNEVEAKKIMSERMNSIEHIEVTVRNKNEHWLKAWIKDNF